MFIPCHADEPRRRSQTLQGGCVRVVDVGVGYHQIMVESRRLVGSCSEMRDIFKSRKIRESVRGRLVMFRKKMRRRASGVMVGGVEA